MPVEEEPFQTLRESRVARSCQDQYPLDCDTSGLSIPDVQAACPPKRARLPRINMIFSSKPTVRWGTNIGASTPNYRQRFRKLTHFARTIKISFMSENFLDEVTGKEALEWVEARNQETFAKLETPRFREMEQAVQKILDNPDKIPYVTRRGEYLYNFWTDAANERGVWRRTRPRPTGAGRRSGRC